MNYQCPVCNAPLIHVRTDDGVIKHRIYADGGIVEIGNHSDGGDEVFCEDNREHKLPMALVDAVLDICQGA